MTTPPSPAVAFGATAFPPVGDVVTTAQREAGFTAKPCPATCVDAWDDEYRCDKAKDHDGHHHDPEYGAWAAGGAS